MALMQSLQATIALAALPEEVGFRVEATCEGQGFSHRLLLKQLSVMLPEATR